MQQGKMVIRRGLKNNWEKKRSEKQNRKGKIYPLNVKFQRRACRDKKAFLNDQSKEVEENNRIGKTRDSSRKLKRQIKHFMWGWAQ